MNKQVSPWGHHFLDTMNENEYSECVSDSVAVWKDKTPGLEKALSESSYEYRRSNAVKVSFIVICILVALVVIGFSLTVGDYSIGFWETYQIIIDHILGNVQDVDKDYVIWDLRMPRIVTGILTGGALAIAGATMQSVMKNPLADPYTTGISSGAGFGATLAICLGVSFAGGGYFVVVNAFLFSLIPTAVIMVVSKMRGASPTTMVMAGIAVMYIFNAFTAVIKLYASPESLSVLYQWSVGTLDSTRWTDVSVMVPFVIVGTIAMFLLSRQLNVLISGDESAKTLGIDADKLRMISILIIALLTASVVSFTGLIGFIGLVCPHVVRMFIGSDNRYLLPASFAFGIALILASDLVGRVVMAPHVFPVGIITSFIGGPLFLYLIMKQRKSAW